jgi:hypothetical protein
MAAARRTLAASDNVLNRHRSDRKGSSGQMPRGAPMMMRSTSAVSDFIAYSALRAFHERVAGLPTAAMPAMPAPAAMPPATAAPPNLLDLSSVSAISEDSGLRLLCDDA